MSASAEAQEQLGLRKPPVAVGFLSEPPPGLPRWAGGPVPSGCTFWQRAMEGEAFYTVPADHYNCAVGSYTHKIGLPQDRSHELQQTIGLMVENRYIELSEVPSIPTLSRSPAVVAYSPVASAPFEPDVVLISARPAQAMLVYEAALRVGGFAGVANVLGRPGCSVLPHTIRSGQAALSFGCIGSRVFAETPDEDIYVSVPGEKWDAVAVTLGEIGKANAAMEKYYRARKAELAS